MNLFGPMLKMNIKYEGYPPSYANDYAAGLDIRANNKEQIVINPGEYKDIPTNLSIEIPKGHFGMIVPRSGLGFKYRLTLINDIGIIDEDYRGTIGIRLLNEGEDPYTIIEGERVAQMIIVPYIQPMLNRVKELSETERNTRGFGSSGRI